jgi:hypothetical protein
VAGLVELAWEDERKRDALQRIVGLVLLDRPAVLRHGDLGWSDQNVATEMPAASWSAAQRDTRITCSSLPNRSLRYSEVRGEDP